MAVVRGARPERPPPCVTQSGGSDGRHCMPVAFDFSIRSEASCSIGRQICLRIFGICWWNWKKVVPELEFICPDWPASSHVRAVASTRVGGISRGAYAGLNLAAHVGDRPEDVAENRRILMQALQLPSEPDWLDQQHGAGVREARAVPETASADASHTTSAGPVCVVQTADCLPVLLCSRKGDWVAAAHVGWKGIAANVLEATVRAYPGSPADLLAWLGPAISAEFYEVDEPVREALGEALSSAALRPSNRTGHWLLDLSSAAAWQLEQAGVADCFGGSWCTFRDERLFYSHRRDRTTGRMATLIWLERR